jgi:hypothetical protein
VLAAARQEYEHQTRLTALAVNQALRLAPRGSIAVARSVQEYQAAAVTVSMEALGGILSEQGIAQAAEATTVPVALLTGAGDLAGMLDNTTGNLGFVRFVETMVRDASRTARSVDQATRPAVTGYIRSLTPPSCGRCAVLAGRVYRYSQGFQRHPKCDCLMTPTNEDTGKHLVTDPMDLFEKGQIRGLSAGDVEAVKAGADLGQVVNVQRKAAGLTVGSSVVARAGRLTPQGCLTIGSDRAQQLALLRRYGYIT